MKNISLSISPFAQPVYPAPPMPAASAMQSMSKLVYSVTLSVQFENEANALKFANQLINVVTGDAE